MTPGVEKRVPDDLWGEGAAFCAAWVTFLCRVSPGEIC